MPTLNKEQRALLTDLLERERVGEKLLHARMLECHILDLENITKRYLKMRYSINALEKRLKNSTSI